MNVAAGGCPPLYEFCCKVASSSVAPNGVPVIGELKLAFVYVRSQDSPGTPAIDVRCWMSSFGESSA